MAQLDPATNLPGSHARIAEKAFCVNVLGTAKSSDGSPWVSCVNDAGTARSCCGYLTECHLNVAGTAGFSDRSCVTVGDTAVSCDGSRVNVACSVGSSGGPSLM